MSTNFDLQKWFEITERGTSGDQVHDILYDWKRDRDALLAKFAEVERELDKALSMVHGQAKIKNKLTMENARAMYDMRVRDGETQSFEYWLLSELSTCAFQRDNALNVSVSQSKQLGELTVQLTEAEADAERLDYDLKAWEEQNHKLPSKFRILHQERLTRKAAG